jgi:hypothetical protein
MTRPFAARRARAALAAALLAPLAALPATAQAPADSAALVTVLGVDTLGLERWVRTPTRVTAEAVVRAPRTTIRRYTLDLAPDGTMRRFEERTDDPAVDVGRPLRVEVYEASGGGWTRTVTQGDSVRETRVEAPPSALPFVDLVHWPYETVLARALATGGGAQPLLSGGRAIDFRVERLADGWSVVHPLRGPTTATVDAEGRLQSMDAAATTRTVVVARVPWLDVYAPARRWAQADAAGRGIGDLSGRGREEANVGGAAILVDYGTPAKRGREIFGTIVKYGELWRTGANRATHLTTSRALVLGDPAAGPTLEVPAGEYTLFSIPAADGGVLIVNRQTGQNGTSYDAARDLGRVPLRRTATPETVERFTIRVEPAGGAAGILRLLWDDTELSVPFTVR